MIYDISPIIKKDIAVFPGDKEFTRKINLDFKNNDNLLLSEITSTLHLGSHADAPNHYNINGISIERVNLTNYIGKCQVIEVFKEPYQRIYPKDIQEYEILEKRILFKTNSFINPYKWNNDFNSLSPELIEYLSKYNVVLIGIDTPSIDPYDSKLLESHNMVYNKNISVLEGITLIEVPIGIYYLIAIPLSIKDGDASPVRAILLKNINLLYN
ncbi:MAG: kynurenine formamidase [Candidatus Sericytochromatia bacterium]|nr:MAG: kynurenine formamidase [Candidatus Sericytochromatia bacterium]